MKKGTKLMGLAVVVVAVLALALGGAVLADAPEETATKGYGAGYGFLGEGAVCSEAVSELLGITPEELCDLRQEGKSLTEIAAEYGVTEEELVAAIMAEKTATVQARVEDGTLTQEQADLMIQQMAERTELAINRTTTGPAEWRMGAGHGKSGEGTGQGMSNRWGGQEGKGACYGDAGTGTGTGSMNRWGRGAR